jgi:hypothetical protein
LAFDNPPASAALNFPPAMSSFRSSPAPVKNSEENIRKGPSFKGSKRCRDDDDDYESDSSVSSNDTKRCKVLPDNFNASEHSQAPPQASPIRAPARLAQPIVQAKVLKRSRDDDDDSDDGGRQSPTKQRRQNNMEPENIALVQSNPTTTSDPSPTSVAAAGDAQMVDDSAASDAPNTESEMVHDSAPAQPSTSTTTPTPANAVDPVSGMPIIPSSRASGDSNMLYSTIPGACDQAKRPSNKAGAKAKLVEKESVFQSTPIRPSGFATTISPFALSCRDAPATCNQPDRSAIENAMVADLLSGLKAGDYPDNSSSEAPRKKRPSSGRANANADKDGQKKQKAEKNGVIFSSTMAKDQLNPPANGEDFIVGKFSVPIVVVDNVNINVTTASLRTPEPTIETTESIYSAPHPAPTSTSSTATATVTASRSSSSSTAILDSSSQPTATSPDTHRVSSTPVENNSLDQASSVTSDQTPSDQAACDPISEMEFAEGEREEWEREFEALEEADEDEPTFEYTSEYGLPARNVQSTFEKDDLSDDDDLHITNHQIDISNHPQNLPEFLRNLPDCPDNETDREFQSAPEPEQAMGSQQNTAIVDSDMADSSTTSAPTNPVPSFSATSVPRSPLFSFLSNGPAYPTGPSAASSAPAAPVFNFGGLNLLGRSPQSFNFGGGSLTTLPTGPAVARVGSVIPGLIMLHDESILETASRAFALAPPPANENTEMISAPDLDNEDESNHDDPILRTSRQEPDDMDGVKSNEEDKAEREVLPDNLLASEDNGDVGSDYDSLFEEIIIDDREEIPDAPDTQENEQASSQPTNEQINNYASPQLAVRGLNLITSGPSLPSFATPTSSPEAVSEPQDMDVDGHDYDGIDISNASPNKSQGRIRLTNNSSGFDGLSSSRWSSLPSPARQGEPAGALVSEPTVASGSADPDDGGDSDDDDEKPNGKKDAEDHKDMESDKEIAANDEPMDSEASVNGASPATPRPNDLVIPDKSIPQTTNDTTDGTEAADSDAQDVNVDLETINTIAQVTSNTNAVEVGELQFAEASSTVEAACDQACGTNEARVGEFVASKANNADQAYGACDQVDGDTRDGRDGDLAASTESHAGQDIQIASCQPAAGAGDDDGNMSDAEAHGDFDGSAPESSRAPAMYELRDVQAIHEALSEDQAAKAKSHIQKLEEALRDKDEAMDLDRKRIMQLNHRIRTLEAGGQPEGLPNDTSISQLQSDVLAKDEDIRVLQEKISEYDGYINTIITGHRKREAALESEVEQLQQSLNEEKEMRRATTGHFIQKAVAMDEKVANEKKSQREYMEKLVADMKAEQNKQYQELVNACRQKFEQHDARFAAAEQTEQRVQGVEARLGALEGSNQSRPVPTSSSDGVGVVGEKLNGQRQPLVQKQQDAEIEPIKEQQAKFSSSRLRIKKRNRVHRANDDDDDARSEEKKTKALEAEIRWLIKEHKAAEARNADLADRNRQLEQTNKEWTRLATSHRHNIYEAYFSEKSDKSDSVSLSTLPKYHREALRIDPENLIGVIQHLVDHHKKSVALMRTTPALPDTPNIKPEVKRLEDENSKLKEKITQLEATNLAQLDVNETTTEHNQNLRGEVQEQKVSLPNRSDNFNNFSELANIPAD